MAKALGPTGTQLALKVLPSMKEAAQKRAEAEGSTVSQVLRDALTDYLARPLPAADEREAQPA